MQVENPIMKSHRMLWLSVFMMLMAAIVMPHQAFAQAQSKPNILFIMGDDIGLYQPSIYHRGLMVGETPNIDRIGNEGATHGLRHWHAAGPRWHDLAGNSRQPILSADRDASAC
jgi:hypothetical protein